MASAPGFLVDMILRPHGSLHVVIIFQALFEVLNVYKHFFN